MLLKSVLLFISTCDRQRMLRGSTPFRSLGLNFKTSGAKEVKPAAIHCKLTLMHSLLPFGMTRQSSQSGTSPLARESKVYLSIVSR